jgi:tetratricopeptide (TPR) repeat protein
MADLLDEGTPQTDKHRLPSRGRKVVGILLAAMVLAAMGIGLVRRLHSGGAAMALLAAGERELALGHVDAAVTALRSAEEQGADPSKVGPALERAELAQRDARGLAAGRAALAEHRFDDARVALQAIESTSPLAPEAQTLRARITPERAAELFARGKEALARHDLDQARSLQQALSALEPELGRQLGDALAEARTTPGADADGPRLAFGTGPNPVVRRELAAGFTLFDSGGSLSSAEVEFARQGRAHPDGAIRAAARALAMGAHGCQVAVGGLHDSSSSSAVGTAVQACAAVNPDGPTVMRLRARLAAALVREGNQAWDRGASLEALKSYRAAQSTDPGFAAAQAGLTRLGARLQQVAERARAERTGIKARDDWTVVLELATPDDPLHHEAARALSGGN